MMNKKFYGNDITRKLT